MADKSKRPSVAAWLAIAVVLVLLGGYYGAYRLARWDYGIYLLRHKVSIAPLYCKTGIAWVDERTRPFFQPANEFEEFRLEQFVF